MIAQKINYFENVQNEQQQDFMQTENQCALCGTALDLRHKIEASMNQIKEEAFCNECETRARAKTFTLQ